MEITKRLRAVNVFLPFYSFTFLPLEIAPVPSDSIAGPPKKAPVRDASGLLLYLLFFCVIGWLFLPGCILRASSNC